MSTTGFRGAPASKAWMLATLVVPLIATLSGLRGYPVLSADAAFYPVCPPPDGAIALAEAPERAPDSIAFIHSPSIWSFFAPLGLINAALHAFPAIMAAYLSPSSSASHLLVLTTQYAVARQTERRLGSSKFSVFLLRAFAVHATLVALLIVGSAWLVRIVDPPTGLLLEPPYRPGDGYGFDLWGVWPPDTSRATEGAGIRLLRRLSQLQIPGPVGLTIPLLALLLRLSPGSWSVQVTLPFRPSNASSVLHAEFKDLHIWTVVVLVLAVSDTGSLISAGLAIAAANLVISPSIPSEPAPATLSKTWWPSWLRLRWWWPPRHEYEALSDGQEAHLSGASSPDSSHQRPEAPSRSMRQRTFAAGATLATRLPLGYRVRSFVRSFWRALARMLDSPPPPRSSRAERRHARIIPMTQPSQADAADGPSNQGGPTPRSRFTRSLANLLARRERPTEAPVEEQTISGNTPAPPATAPALQPRSAGSPFAPRATGGHGPSA